MNKLLTIIIPTYNMEKYISRCLDSLILENEAMRALVEALVIIDGGTDKSADIAKEYERMYPQTFCVIEKTNGHYGSCINRGLEEATGKYIKILDADDYFDKENFANFIAILKDTDCDCILNYAMDFYEDGNKERYYGLSPKDIAQSGIYSKEFTLEDMTLSGIRNPMMHNTTYRTEILRNIRYKQLEGICYTDNQWMFLPMAHTNSITLFPHVLYRYLRGRDDQSVSPKNLKTLFHDEMILTHTLCKEFETYNGNDTGKVYLKRNVYSHIVSLYSNSLLDACYNEKEMRVLDQQLRTEFPSFYHEIDKKRLYLGCHLSISVGFWSRHSGIWLRTLTQILRIASSTIRKIRTLNK